jgi:phage-related holin
MKKKVLKRLQSKIVWLGVLAQVGLVAMAFNPHIADQIKLVGTAVIESATLFGFLNNPDNKEEF